MRKNSMTPEEIQSNLIESLKRNRLRVTQQRLAIIEVLSGNRSHPSASDILNMVRRKIPSVSLSTVYYTLDLFKKDGSIKELEFYDKENRYESNVRHHLDLVCLGCGKIMDYVEQIPIPIERVEKKTGFAVSKIRYEYYGYCKNCRRSGVKKFK
jgi:Fe2+ or Zn2+ uptake regulation protein